MLAVKNLEVVYQDVILVLRGISFEIPKGEIVSLLGSNGSGKTTALRAITGLLDTQNGDITKGQILVEDEELQKKGVLFELFPRDDENGEKETKYLVVFTYNGTYEMTFLPCCFFDHSGCSCRNHP